MDLGPLVVSIRTDSPRSCSEWLAIEEKQDLQKSPTCGYTVSAAVTTFPITGCSSLFGLRVDGLRLILDAL